MSDNSHWFKRKNYGWGWTPRTWQGWALLAVYSALSVAALLQMFDVIEAGEGVMVPVLWLALYGLISTGFMFVVAKKSPKARWQWGDKTAKKKPKSKQKS